MSKMYIYSLETGKHVATVTGTWDKDQQAVEAGEAAGYSTNDHGYTIGADFPKGSENRSAKIIEIRK
jgi:hypothetical protein